MEQTRRGQISDKAHNKEGQTQCQVRTHTTWLKSTRTVAVAVADKTQGHLQYPLLTVVVQCSTRSMAKAGLFTPTLRILVVARDLAHQVEQLSQ